MGEMHNNAGECEAVTEDEAKHRWCPYYQVSADDDDNRSTRYDHATKVYSHSLINAKCLGSECMAWRWKQRTTNQDELDRQRYAASFGSGHHMVMPVYEDTEHGFCGLAGKP